MAEKQSKLVLRCRTCRRETPTIDAYLNHVQEHITMSSKKHYPCPWCQHVLTTRKLFFQHLKGHKKVERSTNERDQESTEPKHCSHCYRFFPSIEVFDDHIKGLTNLRSIDCPDCPSKGIPNYPAYRKHRQRFRNKNIEIAFFRIFVYITS